MDKYEYKIRSEEIKTLIGRKKYAEAMEIADTIDWRKVKNVNMLCTVSDLYKLSRRYEESREILLLAYDRYPGGRMIIYSLCELCIKLDDVVHAVEYYKEFVQTAPRDNGRYVLQYKLYEAQDVTLEERIAVLEELKRREYREKWAYELAYLYHRIGLGTKCVEECDELILWFGEGKYVTKAMELKMLHSPLSEEQQKKYNKSKGITTPPAPAPAPVQPEPTEETEDMDIQVKPVNVGEYATINLQRELAESMKEVLGEEEQPAVQATIEYAAVGTDNYNAYNNYNTDYTTDEIRYFQTEMENNELEIYEEDYQTDEFDEEEVQELQREQEDYQSFMSRQNYGRVQSQPLRNRGMQTQGYDSTWTQDYDTIQFQDYGIGQSEEYGNEEYGVVQSQGYGTGQPQSYGSVQPQSYGSVQPQGYGSVQPQSYGSVQSQGYGSVQPQEYVTVQPQGYESVQSQEYVGIQSRQQPQETIRPQIYQEVQPQETVRPRNFGRAQSQIFVNPQPQTFLKAQPAREPELSIEGPGEFTREILTNLLQDTEEEQAEYTANDQYIPKPEQEEVFFEDPDTMEISLPPLEEEPARVVKMSRTAEIPKIIQNGEEDTNSRIRLHRKQLPEEASEDMSVQEPEVTVEEAAAEDIQIVEPEPEPGQTPAEDKDESIPKPEKPIISEEKEEPFTQESAENNMKQKRNNYEDFLTQENDGQICLAVSSGDEIERQITGQMSIGDILLEWEKMKKENEEQRAEAIRKRVKEQTGEIFSQFDASTKEGILAELDALAEETERRERNQRSGEQELPADSVSEPVENLPEMEASEEIKEISPAQRFSEEERDSVNSALDEVPTEEVTNISESIPDAEEESEILQAEKREEIEKKAADRKEDKPISEKPVKSSKPEKVQRTMTADEKKLFGPFIQTRSTKDQILDTLDNISLASYTGNVILTGEAGMGSIKLAKNIIKEIQMTDSNFSGRMAKITGQALNNKDMEKTFSKLSNGALIVEGAGELKETAIKSMVKLLEQEEQGIIVILEDTKINMNKLLDNYKVLHQNFNLRIDIEALDNNSLVLFAKKYALEREYAMDELGELALHTRISELQTSEHSVTTKEVKEIVDEAIHHAGRKNMSHFMDVLLGKRYDDEDMIILREKDFV